MSTKLPSQVPLHDRYSLEDDRSALAEQGGFREESDPAVERKSNPN